jgi:hypothetical protein
VEVLAVPIVDLLLAVTVVVGIVHLGAECGAIAPFGSLLISVRMGIPRQAAHQIIRLRIRVSF